MPLGRHPLRWRPALRAQRLATAAALALLAALVTGRAALLLIAAPPLAVLAAASRGNRPAEIEIGVAAGARRCFEGEDLELRVSVRCATNLDDIAIRFALADAFELAPGPAAGRSAFVQASAVSGRTQGRWLLRARRWGRHLPGSISVVCHSAGGMWEATAGAAAPAIEVFPAARARPSLVPVDLLRRIGEHTGRAAGGGAEFAGIRPYQPGDRLRDVNWRVTSRRGGLHINQRAAERAADVVVMIDAFSHVGPPGASTLDLAVRGATALAAAYLRIGDRVGVVTLGGMLRWLAPGASELQFYRIVQTVFDVWMDSAATPDLGRIPRTALPPGALAVVFSPLLDDRAVSVLADLRERRFPVVVVDVLNTGPAVPRPGRTEALALRLWRLDRQALLLGLGEQGIPIVTWDGSGALDTALMPLRRVPLLARQR